MPSASRKPSSAVRRMIVVAGLCGEAEHHRLRAVGEPAPHVVQVGVVGGERARHDAGAGQRRPDRVGLEGGLRHDHLVAGLERRRRHQRDQLVGAVADHELVGPGAEAVRQRFAQRGRAAVGVEVNARGLARDGGHGPRRGPRGFSLAESRTMSARPSSAARLSSGGPGSYRVRTSRTGRQRRRTRSILVSLRRI